MTCERVNQPSAIARYGEKVVVASSVAEGDERLPLV